MRPFERLRSNFLWCTPFGMARLTPTVEPNGFRLAHEPEIAHHPHRVHDSLRMAGRLRVGEGCSWRICRERHASIGPRAQPASLPLRARPSNQQAGPNEGRQRAVPRLLTVLLVDRFAGFGFLADRLKLTGACIGGNSIADFASSATVCCTLTNRQNTRAQKSLM
jgi:hypothetical protein